MELFPQLMSLLPSFLPAPPQHTNPQFGLSVWPLELGRAKGVAEEATAKTKGGKPTGLTGRAFSELS